MNPKQVRFGIPGLAGAFTLAAGVVGYFCKSPEVMVGVLGLLVVAAIASAFAIVVD